MNFIAKLVLIYLRNFSLEIGRKKLTSLIPLDHLKGEFVYTNKLGLKFNLDINEYVMKQIYLSDIYEKPYLNFLSSFPKENINNIFDIGANIGNHSIVLSKSYPNSVIHSFEPNTINYNRLIKNIELNKFHNIKTNKLGLSNSKGELKLYSDKENMGASTLAKNINGEGEIIKVTTLDEYCEENNIQQIDLLKIDIEGGELNCFKGSTKILEQTKRGIIQLEVDNRISRLFNYEADELFNIPLKYGYKPYTMDKIFWNTHSIKVLPKDFVGNIFYLKGY